MIPDTTNALQTRLNQVLEARFDAVFQDATGDALTAFLHFSTSRLPTILEPEEMPVKLTFESDDQDLPALAELERGSLKLSVSRELGIRLYYQGRQITTDRNNIPLDYPWFSPDPADLEQVAEFAARHVARGSRADTWPEDQWPQVGGIRQGEQNWPPRSLAFGPYRLSEKTKSDNSAILVSSPSSGPNEYGVIPRGLFKIASNGTVLMAWQNENQSEKNLSWAAWFILGFAMPSVSPSYTDPSVIFAYPDAESSEPADNEMKKIWNYADFGGTKIAMINPHIKTLNEPFKKFHRDTNWSVIAEKGRDTLILTRSILRHDEQFFPFLEHGRHFIEAEHTGRRAAPGEKSTVLISHDFLPLLKLTQGRLERFPTEKSRFEQAVRDILSQLAEMDRAGKLVSQALPE